MSDSGWLPQALWAVGCGLDLYWQHLQCMHVQDHTPICDVLKTVEYADCEDFFQKYVHDFARLVHQCNHRDTGHKNREYRVSISRFLT